MIRLLPLLVGCGPWMTEGDYMTVHRAGADMPVWVRGNVDSGVFVVTLHGGPGHAGHEFVTSAGMRTLEEDYAMVYWDQRASGMSQGNPSPDTFTVADFVADTDLVIEVVRERYGVDDVFLLGHSWGGNLSLATMILGEQREHVRGVIPYAATHDEQLSLDQSVEWTLGRIEEVIAEGKDVEYWRDVRHIYETTEPTPASGWHDIYAGALGAYFWHPEDYVPPDTIELALASPFSLSFYENSRRSLRLVEPLLVGFDLTDELDTITAPALVISGEHDGKVPLETAEILHELLGTPEADKSLEVCLDVAHSCHDEDPDRFVEIVTGFVERYR